MTWHSLFLFVEYKVENSIKGAILFFVLLHFQIKHCCKYDICVFVFLHSLASSSITEKVIKPFKLSLQRKVLFFFNLLINDCSLFSTVNLCSFHPFKCIVHFPNNFNLVSDCTQTDLIVISSIITTLRKLFYLSQKNEALHVCQIWNKW